MATERICSVLSCHKKHYAKDLCFSHYQKLRKYGDPLGAPPKRLVKLCAVDECECVHYSKGLCATHYTRVARTGSVNVSAPRYAKCFGEPLRFLMETALSHEGPDCIVWPFARRRRGRMQYGRVYYEGKTWNAHRLVCFLKNGPPPSIKHMALHKCGNGHLACVSPGCVYWGIRVDNVRDAMRHGTVPKGETHHGAKLTEAAVLSLRACASMTRKELAVVYGVTPGTITAIRNGRSWSWL